MNQISKPHLVDLLRIFDRKKFFVPRIRYASVRSKPELLHDLYRYFGTRLTDTFVEFIPKASVPSHVPSIRYHLSERKFQFDGEPVDPPTHNRYRASFSVRTGPVVVYFDGRHFGSAVPASPPSR